MSLHIIFPLCVTLCVQISPFYKDTSHMGIGLTLLQGELVLANYICSHPVSK